jgi:hypothetical protein
MLIKSLPRVPRWYSFIWKVGARLLLIRIEEMRRKRIHPPAAAISLQMAARLENVRP